VTCLRYVIIKRVVSVMLWSKDSPVWDGPSTGSSLVGLFLGGILWEFSRAHEHGDNQCWDLLAERYESQTWKHKTTIAIVGMKRW
jgi:hypothetical protein